ncbi:MAG TPA: efflux RND transporter periplasmic adaptor subunit [Xanthobacteraceae bacterium]|nr:efflux RND transporter periplasmic adaptor subunit [Xanthobacteraceae bacterium]
MSPETSSQPEQVQSAPAHRALRLAALAIVIVATTVVIVGITTRKIADAHLREWTDKQAVPVVSVIAPDTRSNRSTLDVPGRLEAYSQAQIYSRVSGYIKSWKADIGSPVKAGDLLAEIDAPDLDQQIMQAHANVASATANANLSNATLQRGQSLSQSGSVSKQELDQRAADFANKSGLVRSAQANLDMLRVLEKYKSLAAPFDGLITARTTDVGALISAGGNGLPLFVVSDTAKLRVYVNVPQNYVPSIKVGTKAQITVPEYQGRSFTATVESSARAVDIASGTTRMQLLVDNAGGELMTGGFANVRLDLPQPEDAISVPASALIFDQQGMRVATVGSDNRVVIKPITIARDLGRIVEIATGLEASDRVVESPPDGIAHGDLVRLTGSPGNVSAPGTAASKPVANKPPG